MVLLGGATAASIIRLRCPSCGEVQARARQPAGARYACRACGHVFTPPVREQKPAPRVSAKKPAKRSR